MDGDLYKGSIEFRIALEMSGAKKAEDINVYA